jgi:ATP-dependent DNA ligase
MGTAKKLPAGAGCLIELSIYSYDVLALGDDDLRALPLHLRKANLAQLLARRPDERGEIGPDLFRSGVFLAASGSDSAD